MKFFCNNCMKVEEFSSISKMEELESKKVKLKIDVKVLQCGRCNNEINDPEFDSIRAAMMLIEKI